MHPILPTRSVIRITWATFASLAFASTALLAQSFSTGTVTGRVQDATAAMSLENARVAIAGSNREAFTDAFGEYRFTGLPAGPVTLRVSYTGLEAETATVTVPAGGTAQHDFALASTAAKAAGITGGVVKLDEFVVSSARETNAAAIAINEQRFGASAKTVVSTDALGIVGENNIGEFVKFLPGVDVVTDQMNAVAIQLRGMPQAYTGISVDGEPMNVAATSGPSRSMSLQTVSLVNATRIEIYKVPTPDMPASSLGGSINLVSRTAFEKSKPEFQFKAFLNKNSHHPTYAKAWSNDGDSTNRSFFGPGPSFDFNYTVPLSKNFGFSVNAVKFDQFNSVRQIRRTFNTSVAANNPLRSTLDNPYLQIGNYLWFPITERKYNLGMRLDWKLSPTDKISFSHSGGYFQQDIPSFTFNINTGTNPVSWGPDFTHGRPGSGRVFASNNARHYSVRNNALRLTYSHIGSLWDWNANLAYGLSTKWFRELSYDQLTNAAAEIANATVDLDGFDAFTPGRVTVRNAAGTVVDPFDLRNYNFFVNGGIQTRDASAESKSARLDGTRKFFADKFNLSAKAGLLVKEEYADYRLGQFYPAYVGPDGRAASGDEGIARSPIDPTNYWIQGIDFPRGMATPPFPSTRRGWDLFRQYPQYFDLNANRRPDLLQDLTTPFDVTERIEAGYVMGDLTLLQNRLRIVAGVRYEKTIDNGRGVLQDNNAQYRHDPATGAVLLDANRRPIFAIAPEKTVRTTLTPEEGIAQDALVYHRLGAHTHKSYGDYYPSVNASYQITPNTIGRLGLARTLGRPEFTNLVGAANVTTNDFDPNSNSSGAALGTIATKNPGLKPWTADSLDLRLEYYTPTAGDVSVGFFRKQIKNFFASTVTIATPEFLDSINLSRDYVGYQVTAPFNSTALVHVNGWEFAVNQPLGGLTRIEYAKYFRVFANATLIQTKGPEQADLRGFSPKNINWGVMFNRRPVSLAGKWYLIGKRRLTPTAAGVFGAPGWTYQMERLRFDASLDYQLTKHYSLYLTGRNIFNDRDQQEAYAPGSPRYVRPTFEGEYGVTYQFGIKGSF